MSRQTQETLVLLDYVFQTGLGQAKLEYSVL